MRNRQAPAAVVNSGTIRSREENVMRTKRSQRSFIYVVLAAATLVAALEVTAARGGGPTPKPRTPWLAPLETMDQAIARGDVASAVTARHEAYRAAIASRRWEGFLAAGDAILRLGEATQSRSRAEPEARRLYWPALFRARGQQSLDGVLLATEAFARLGDRDVVEQGLRMARDLAGSDPEAQARVRLVEDRSPRSAAAGGAPAHVVR
jgi:hypothetical protein